MNKIKKMTQNLLNICVMSLYKMDYVLFLKRKIVTISIITDNIIIKRESIDQYNTRCHSNVYVKESYKTVSSQTYDSVSYVLFY